MEILSFSLDIVKCLDEKRYIKLFIILKKRKIKKQ